ncbi:MAG: bactofilin family protein [Thermoanaerobaculia bacterium]
MRLADSLRGIVSLAAFVVISALFVAPGVMLGEAPTSAGVPSPVGDVSAIGRDVTLSAPVSGSVQVVGGTATVDATVDGSIMVIAGTLKFGSNAVVAGDVVALASRVEGLDRAQIRGDVFAPGSLAVAIRRGNGATLGAMDKPVSLVGLALNLSLLFGWLLAALALTFGAAREVRFSSSEARSSTLHVFTLGLVAFTSFVLTAIVLGYLIPFGVGVPLLALLGFFAVVTKIYGMVAVFHAVGTLVAGARSHDDLERRRWLRGDLAMVLIGLLILGAIRLIPFVGALVWMIASICGVGVALATRFGRRDPWFLAFRPVEP